jgi:hypothetical protein
MRIDNLSDEEIDHYTLDFPRTVAANLPNFIWLGIMFYFLFYTFKFITAIQDEYGQVLALLILLFAIIKMNILVSPVIQYKPKEVRNEN